MIITSSYTMAHSSQFPGEEFLPGEIAQNVDYLTEIRGVPRWLIPKDLLAVRNFEIYMRSVCDSGHRRFIEVMETPQQLKCDDAVGALGDVIYLLELANLVDYSKLARSLKLALTVRGFVSDHSADQPEQVPAAFLDELDIRFDQLCDITMAWDPVAELLRAKPEVLQVDTDDEETIAELRRTAATIWIATHQQKKAIETQIKEEFEFSFIQTDNVDIALIAAKLGPSVLGRKDKKKTLQTEPDFLGGFASYIDPKNDKFKRLGLYKRTKEGVSILSWDGDSDEANVHVSNDEKHEFLSLARKYDLAGVIARNWWQMERRFEIEDINVCSFRHFGTKSNGIRVIASDWSVEVSHAGPFFKNLRGQARQVEPG